MVEADYVEIPKQTEVKKIKPPSMWPCECCGKSTRSHIFEDKTVLCHGCYENLSDEELAAHRECHRRKQIERHEDKA